MNEPAEYGFREAKFIHTPQIICSHSDRLRCQYLCSQQRQSALCPPFSPTNTDTQRSLEEYRFGLFIRTEAQPEGDPRGLPWREFQDAVLSAERECFIRGYSRAFAIGIGNCIHQHHGDAYRPCDYPDKARPTLEAIGVNLTDTLDLLGWDRYLLREPEEPYQLFAVLLLE